MSAHNPEISSTSFHQDPDAWLVDTKASENNDSMTKLPALLRGFGAIVVLASISIFMFQGWDSSNDIGRYLLLLGHTGVLAAIGFLSGHFMRESKGARLLLTISLASVPANFAILGGFIYSQFSMDGINVIYPGIVSWSAGSPASALIVTVLSAVLLLPVMILGFMVLNRRSAAQFTVLFLISNLVLLLPLRHAGFTGWTTLGMAILVMYSISKACKRNPSIRTMDGRIARVLQFMPPVVMAARSVWLYSADVFIITALSMLVFLLIRHVAMLMEKESSMRRVLETFSIIPAAAVGLGIADLVQNSFVAFDGIFLGVFSMVTAGLILDLSFRSANDGARQTRRAL